MRSAGVQIEALIEYVRLYQMGDSTIEARRDLLQEQYEVLEEQRRQINATMERLKYNGKEAVGYEEKGDIQQRAAE